MLNRGANPAGGVLKFVAMLYFIALLLFTPLLFISVVSVAFVGISAESLSERVLSILLVIIHVAPYALLFIADYYGRYGKTRKVITSISIFWYGAAGSVIMFGITGFSANPLLGGAYIFLGVLCLLTSVAWHSDQLNRFDSYGRSMNTAVPLYV